MLFQLSSHFNATACLIIGVLDNSILSPEQKKLDALLNGLLARLVKKLNQPGQISIQSDLVAQMAPNSPIIENLIVINCGNKDKYSAEILEKYLKISVKQVTIQNCTNATFSFPDVTALSSKQQLEFMLRVIDNAIYIQPQFKHEVKPQILQTIDLHLPHANSTDLEEANIIAEAIRFTRNLTDLPANYCTPRHLSNSAIEISQSFSNVTAKILQHAEIKTLGMGGLLAVSQGSAEPPCFIELKYQGLKNNDAPIVLIGKGITFDAGGISLKPPANMHEMKYDMAGAAVVLGTLFAAAKLKLPLNLMALVPAAENLPSGKAIKPGDVITMMSKQTVEVINTDAEGRLIVADALCYAAQFKPKYVIDVATLTGAVIVALGTAATGIMANDDSLANDLLLAAQHSFDKAWRLPLFPEYEEKMTSPNADFMNATADREAGSIMGGMFLEKFVQNYSWAHLDIAGTAWVSGSKRVATGRPLPLLLEFLRHVCHKS